MFLIFFKINFYSFQVNGGMRKIFFLQHIYWLRIKSEMQLYKHRLYLAA